MKKARENGNHSRQLMWKSASENLNIQTFALIAQKKSIMVIYGDISKKNTTGEGLSATYVEETS